MTMPAGLVAVRLGDYNPSSLASNSLGVNNPLAMLRSITSRGTDAIDTGMIEWRQLKPPANE